MRIAFKVLVRKSEGNRPLRRHRCRWEDNIRKDLREIGWEGVDWWAVVNTVIEASGSIRGREHF
jgi:hypothetical protein